MIGLTLSGFFNYCLKTDSQIQIKECEQFSEISLHTFHQSPSAVTMQQGNKSTASRSAVSLMSSPLLWLLKLDFALCFLSVCICGHLFTAKQLSFFSFRYSPELFSGTSCTPEPSVNQERIVYADICSWYSPFCLHPQTPVITENGPPVSWLISVEPLLKLAKGLASSVCS